MKLLTKMRWRVGLLLSLALLPGAGPPPPPAPPPPPPDSAVCVEFNLLNDRIRDQTIGRATAQRQLAALLPRLDAYYAARGGAALAAHADVFPLAGYSAAAIGGRKGNGYQPAGYDYFVGNRHSGHPAHDIFIYDNNQDSRDDRTRQPVAVRALTGGVVVALSTSWNAGSPLRGGNYVWVYAPAERSLFYYAHNATVRVALGELVRPGDILATVGRTGRNASPPRSPTHLHLMQLSFDARERPRATDCYGRLCRVRSFP